MDPSDERPILIPVEQLPITLFDHVILAVRRDDGRIYLSVRDLCQALAIDPSSQLRRLNANAKLRPGLARFRVTTPGGRQAQDFFVLDRVPTWLLMINPERVDAAVRPRLEFLQDHLIQAVYQAFAQLAGLPEAHQVEDLADLQRIEHALTALSERQTQIEESQDKARLAWRDLHRTVQAIAARVQEVEQRVGGTISKGQRGHIYQLVQHWAAAKQQHDTRITSQAAFAACWSMLKARFRLARYEDLPTGQYAACIAFIEEQYLALTGERLTLPEQGELGLE